MKSFRSLCTWLRISLVAAAAVALLYITVAAQSSGVIVTHVSLNERSNNGGLDLNVFFTVVDTNGRPLTGVDVDAATIEVLGGQGEPTEAAVQKPNTPINVALLLDASGSMAQLIGDVREAAKSSLQNAPPNANFGVFKFNEVVLDQEFRPIQPFTNDRNLVASAIDAVQSDPNGPTCLYNALSKAIEVLEEQRRSPEERSAIIVFTDGRDERANGAACSQLGFDDIVYRAGRNALARTAIHTIGLCEDERCSNINRNELQRLAGDTLGFSAIGGQTNLSSLFQEIMDGLNSQWLARASVCTGPGAIEAVLKAQIRDAAFPPAAFIFNSAQDCRQAPTPPDVNISSVRYDPSAYNLDAPTPGGDLYRVTLSIVSPEQLQRVIVSVWDVAGGTQVVQDKFYDTFTSGLPIEIETLGLIAGREYRIQVYAEDTDGFLIRKPQPESSSSSPPTTLLATHEFKYEPPQKAPPQPVQFTIEPPDQPDWQNNKLMLNLNIAEAERVATYAGFISDGNGSKIAEIPLTSFTSEEIVLDLPPQMWQSRNCSLRFTFTFELTAVEGPVSRLTSDEFRPCRPPLVQRMMIWTRNNPWTLASIIGFLVSCLIVWFIFRYWSQRRKPPEAPTPHEYTVVATGGLGVEGGATPPKKAGAAAPVEPGKYRLRLKITHSPQQPAENETVLNQFPCVIGRDEFISHFELLNRGSEHFLNMGVDEKISRRHIEITVRNGMFYLTDLKSRNGTFVESRKLEPHKPTTLSGFTAIQLGRRTSLELEPLP